MVQERDQISQGPSTGGGHTPLTSNTSSFHPSTIDNPPTSMAESSSKLQPFLLLARSTKGAAAAKVILDVTAAVSALTSPGKVGSSADDQPGVYVFSELLELPNIQELRDQPEHQNAYRLLELFAYGTLSDYDGKSSSHRDFLRAHSKARLVLFLPSHPHT